MTDNNEIEEKLLFEDGADAYDQYLEGKVQAEIDFAKREREKLYSREKETITDIKKIPPDKKFHKDTIYKVFNRQQKTETFVTGEQAENLMGYTDDYIVRFHHRIE